MAVLKKNSLTYGGDNAPIGVQTFYDAIGSRTLDIKFLNNQWGIAFLIGNINGFGNAFIDIRIEGGNTYFFTLAGVDITSTFPYEWIGNTLRITAAGSGDTTWRSATILVA